MSDEEDWANDGVLETWSATRRSASRLRRRSAQHQQQHHFQEGDDDDEWNEDDERLDDEEFNDEGVDDDDGDDFTNAGYRPSSHRGGSEAGEHGGHPPQDGIRDGSPLKKVHMTRAAQMRAAARRRAKTRIDAAAEDELRAAERLAQRAKVGPHYLPHCASLGTESMPLRKGGHRAGLSRTGSGASHTGSASEQQQHQHLDPKKREQIEQEQRLRERERELQRAVKGRLPVDASGIDIGTRLYQMGRKPRQQELELQLQHHELHSHIVPTQQRREAEEAAQCTFRPHISEVAELLFPAARSADEVVRSLATTDAARRRARMQHLRAASDAAFSREHTFVPETAPVSQLLNQRSDTVHHLPSAPPGSMESATAVAKAASERLFRDAADRDVRDALRRQFVTMWQQHFAGGVDGTGSGSGAAAALSAAQIADLTERLSRRHADKESVLAIIREEQRRQRLGDAGGGGSEPCVPGQNAAEFSICDAAPRPAQSSAPRQHSASHHQRRELRLIDALCPVAGQAKQGRRNQHDEAATHKLAAKLVTLQLSDRKRVLH